MYTVLSKKLKTFFKNHVIIVIVFLFFIYIICVCIYTHGEIYRDNIFLLKLALFDTRQSWPILLCLCNSLAGMSSVTIVDYEIKWLIYKIWGFNWLTDYMYVIL